MYDITSDKKIFESANSEMKNEKIPLRPVEQNQLKNAVLSRNMTP